MGHTPKITANSSKKLAAKSLKTDGRVQLQTSWMGSIFTGKMAFQRDKRFAKVASTMKLDALNVRQPLGFFKTSPLASSSRQTSATASSRPQMHPWPPAAARRQPRPPAGPRCTHGLHSCQTSASSRSQTSATASSRPQTSATASSSRQTSPSVSSSRQTSASSRSQKSATASSTRFIGMVVTKKKSLQKQLRYFPLALVSHAPRAYLPQEIFRIKRLLN